jgi:hypothetical protein
MEAHSVLYSGLGFAIGVGFSPTSRPTSGCSRIATARFFKYFLLAKLVYNVTDRAYPQSAEPRALGRRPVAGVDLMRSTSCRWDQVRSWRGCKGSGRRVRPTRRSSGRPAGVGGNVNR